MIQYSVLLQFFFSPILQFASDSPFHLEFVHSHPMFDTLLETSGTGLCIDHSISLPVQPCGGEWLVSPRPCLPPLHRIADPPSLCGLESHGDQEVVGENGLNESHRAYLACLLDYSFWRIFLLKAGKVKE